MKFVINNHSFEPFRIFCIGKNYEEHIKELGDSNRPEEPIIFMKPTSSIVPNGNSINYSHYFIELHHETEVVLMIGKEGRNIAEEDAHLHIVGITLGLDLTLRDVQNKLKKNGLPWELSKSFEQSAPIGHFVAYEESFINLEDLSFSCYVNNDLRQKGNTKDMIFSIKSLISKLSLWWTLKPGDIIFTGTPSGVGPLLIGDQIKVQSSHIGSFSWKVVQS